LNYPIGLLKLHGIKINAREYGFQRKQQKEFMGLMHGRLNKNWR
jgi:hypothetical protein